MLDLLDPNYAPPAQAPRDPRADPDDRLPSGQCGRAAPA